MNNNNNNMNNKTPSRFLKTDILYDDLKSIDYCYVSTHDYCCIIIKKLTEFIENKTQIPEKLIERFFKVIVKAIECWSLNYDTNLERLTYIFKNVNMTNNLICSLFYTHNFEAIHIFLQNNENMNIELLKNILNILSYDNDDDMENSFDILINNIIKDNDINKINIIFEYAIKNKSIYIINKILDTKYKPSEKDFIKLLTFLKINNEPKEIIKKCVLNGIEIKKDFIHQYIENILYNNYNYTYVDNGSFYDIFTYLYDNGSTYINIYEILKCHIKINKTVINNVVNYFIDNTTKITREDFILLCKEGIHVSNIKKIQEFFDDNEIQILIFEKNLTYPIKITYNLEILRNECKKKNNLKQIQKILSDKTNIIKPDVICLENACGISNNNAVIKLLHETYNIPFNDNCIVNYAYTLKQHRLLRYILEKFKLNNKINNVNINNVNINDDNINNENIIDF
jgi:hypothetical protein